MSSLYYLRNNRQQQHSCLTQSLPVAVARAVLSTLCRWLLGRSSPKLLWPPKSLPSPLPKPHSNVGKDPHGGNRAKALEASPGDLGLLLDDETEKRYKALQKKVRDMCKLHDKEFDSLDKLQKEKLTQEPGLIQDIQDINAKAQEALTKRRQARA
ncbi:unnamed protein product [Polarella glacialis]|uniref:Uncharacterized protein n=1 Tax=Polarella glacialis TaxID=89957 RepID=A0A813LP87_POLGL|nr:unnamed protein product [Polarella glacialis]